MRRRFQISLALVLVTQIAIALSAASSLEKKVLGGSISISRPTARGSFRSLDFDLTGETFRLRGSEGDGRTLRMISRCEGPIEAGIPFRIESDVAVQGLGFAEVDGRHFSPVVFNQDRKSIVRLQTSDLTLPYSKEASISLKAPFTMHGSISSSAQQAPMNSFEPVFVGQVSGSGTATVELTRQGDAHIITNITYDFDDTP